MRLHLLSFPLVASLLAGIVGCSGQTYELVRDGHESEISQKCKVVVAGRPFDQHSWGGGMSLLIPDPMRSSMHLTVDKVLKGDCRQPTLFIDEMDDWVVLIEDWPVLVGYDSQCFGRYSNLKIMCIGDPRPWLQSGRKGVPPDRFLTEPAASTTAPSASGTQ